MADSGTGITVTTNKLKEVLNKIHSFELLELLVGVPEKKLNRKKDKKEDKVENKVKKQTEGEEEKTPMNNAWLAYIHEFGEPKVKIPPRPFLLPGISKVKPEIARILYKHAKKFMGGGGSPIRTGLEESGQKAVSSAKNIIRTQENFKKLKDTTLAARKKQGFEGEKALIRTAQLLNSITYVVREK